MRTDGFEARNSNHSSGQDAIAVSADARRFAVADGLGGATDTEGTRFLSRFMADAAVQRGVDGLFDPGTLSGLYAEADTEFAAQEGRGFRTSRMRSQLGGSVATTLTFGEVIDKNHVRVVIIGDSPAFLMDKAMNPVAQYGEDAQSGLTDSVLAFKLGRDQQGNPITPSRSEVVDGKRVVDTIIEVPDGYSVSLGTDYFSDTAASEGRHGTLSDFIGRTPEEFHDATVGMGKPDDASLITFTPGRLA